MRVRVRATDAEGAMVAMGVDPSGPATTAAALKRAVRERVEGMIKSARGNLNAALKAGNAGMTNARKLGLLKGDLAAQAAAKVLNAPTPFFFWKAFYNHQPLRTVSRP